MHFAADDHAELSQPRLISLRPDQPHARSAGEECQRRKRRRARFTVGRRGRYARARERRHCADATAHAAVDRDSRSRSLLDATPRSRSSAATRSCARSAWITTTCSASSNSARTCAARLHPQHPARPRNETLVGSGALALASLPALGEKADRAKPLNYEADSGECDDLKQVCVLVGNVVLNKGTMRAAGERVQVRKDPEGYQSGVIIAAPGKLATFRQRRDSSKPGSRGIRRRVRRAHRVRRERRYRQADDPRPRAAARKRSPAR